MYNANNNALSNPYYKNESSDILSVSELSDYLNIGKNRAYELLNNGTIKGFRIGSTWRVSMAAVNDYIKKASGL